MKRTNKTGIVLIYNCTDPKFAKLNQIFAMLGLRMRRIKPEQYELPLLSLTRGEGEAASQAQPFEENMLVFCGLNQVFLNQILEVIRLAKLPPIQLKAVLTADNQEWNSIQLHDELLQEREKLAQAAQSQEEN